MMKHSLDGTDSTLPWVITMGDFPSGTVPMQFHSLSLAMYMSCYSPTVSAHGYCSTNVTKITAAFDRSPG